MEADHLCLIMRLGDGVLDENGGGYFTVYNLGNTKIMALGKNVGFFRPCCLDHHWDLAQIKKLEMVVVVVHVC